MNFSEIRQKYPEYDDMNDEQFAQAFHRKFYSDMSYEDFTNKLQYKSSGKGDTSLLENIKISAAGAGEVLDRYGTGLEIALKNLYDKDAAEKAYNELEERNKKRQQYANPENKKQSFGGKVAGTLFPPNLALQVLAFPFSPATTGQTMLEQGESLGSAVGGTLADTVGNMAGVALPGAMGTSIIGKAASGALINAGQDAATRATIAALADKQSTKDLLGPSIENTALSAIVGAGLGPLSPTTKKPRVIDDPNNRLNSIKPSVEDTTQSGTPAFKFNKRLDINLDDGVNAPEVFRVDGMGNQAEAYHPTFETEVARVAAMDRMVEALDAEVAKPPGISNTGRGPAKGGISPELLTFGLSNLFNKKQPKFLDDILNTKLYAEAVSGDDVVKAALAEGPEKPSNFLTRATTNMGSGGTMEAAKRNSVAILGSSRIIQRAKNIAEDKIRSTVFPVENSLRQAKKSIEHLASFLKREQVGKELLGEKALADEGADLKAVAAYSQLRNMQKTTGDYINSTLSSLGKRNIELDPAYMTSVFKGDFKTIFYREIINDDGSVKNKPVAVISADTKLGLKQQLKAFKEQNPDLANLKTEDASVKGPGRQGSDFTRIFNTMLEVLGENDPAMQKVAAWAEMNTEMQGKKMLGETKHFIPKTGVMGYVGDRPSNTIFGGFNNKKEALAYLQAQVDVAKAAYQWGEMQKAAIEMKKILSNEELAAQQPHIMRFVRDYWLDNLGMTDSAVARAIDDTVLRKWLGVSPAAASNIINHIKSFWISLKILGAPFWIANGIQYLNVIPHLTDMSVKWGGNPIYAISSGMMDGLLTALGHMAHTLKGSDDIKPNLYRIAAQGGLSEFSIRAMKYAEDNSVTTRSIYDEAPIESSIVVLGPAKRVATGLISAPETFLRSFAYMTYAHMLKSSGKFTNDMDVFRMAEERVNRSMGDYRTGERALMFGKMGTVGTAANTLTTFPMNYFNNWSWAAREAGRGNMLPFVAMFATQFLAAGAMGIPGFADMDKIWEWIKGTQKDNPKTWDKIKDIDLQEIARSFGGDLGLYGLPSVLTDTALTSRAAAPLGTEMVQTPGAPFADLARQGSSVLSAAMDPFNEQKRGQALYNISPPLTQGLFETTILRDLVSNPDPKDPNNRKYMNPRDMADREGMVDRGPRDEKLRKFGLRSLNEQKTLDLVYKAKKKNTDSMEVGQNAMKEAYNAARLGNKEKAREYINLYVKLTGSQNPDIEALVKREFMTRAERAPETLTTPAGMRAVKIMNEILNESKQE